MTNPLKNSTGANTLRLLVAALIVLAFFGRAAAQTPGGTVISNQASATYSDGTNSYATVSNTVTVTVSNVSGITITPDAGSNPTVVAGQTGVLYDFTVSNTGNFTDQVRFLRERRQCSRRWAGYDYARGHRRGQQRIRSTAATPTSLRTAPTCCPRISRKTDRFACWLKSA